MFSLFKGFKSGSLGYMAITQLGIDSIKCPFVSMALYSHYKSPHEYYTVFSIYLSHYVQGCLNRRGGVNAWSKRGFDGHCAHSHPNEVVIPVEYMKHQGELINPL